MDPPPFHGGLCVAEHRSIIPVSFIELPGRICTYCCRTEQVGHTLMFIIPHRLHGIEDRLTEERQGRSERRR